MVEQPDAPVAKNKGIYLLPNMLTTAALFAGFYAIVAAMNNKFETSAIALFIALIFDGLDGRVARLTGTESAFGAQYDSLSDMLCFGVTPALMVYSWGLYSLGKLGWLAAFIYTAAVALRLARFNTQLDIADKKYFTGLPCPPPAAAVAGMVWIMTDFGIPGRMISEIVAVITVLLAVLMVSNIKYYSFKELDFKGNVPFAVILIAALVIPIIAWDPSKMLFGIAFIYSMSGLVIWILSWLGLKKKPKEDN
jgi:CDP-diacylglycerol---serine O-phosphatidyltransferase